MEWRKSVQESIWYIYLKNVYTYVEEVIIPTFGILAVLSIRNCDNDGKNWIDEGSFWLEHDQLNVPGF